MILVVENLKCFPYYFTVLSVDPSSVSTQIRWLATAHKSSSRGIHCLASSVHVNRPTLPPTQLKIMKNLKTVSLLMLQFLTCLYAYIFACMSVYHHRRGCQTGVGDGCKLSGRCWKLKWGPLIRSPGTSLQMVVSCVWILGIVSWSSGRATNCTSNQ